MPITKEQWKALAGKGQWDVMVALRGPDLDNSDTIKHLSTGVLRHAVSDVMRVGGIVNGTLPCIILPHTIYSTPDQGTERSVFSWIHWSNHIVAAAAWLKIPIIYIPIALWMEVTAHSYSKALSLLRESPYTPAPLREIVKGLP